MSAAGCNPTRLFRLGASLAYVGVDPRVQGEQVLAWGRPSSTPRLRRNGHQRAIKYLDRKSVVPYSRAVQPCGIQLREIRPYTRHQPNPGPGRQVTHPRGKAVRGGREPVPSHPRRALHPPHGPRRGAPAARRGSCLHPAGRRRVRPFPPRGGHALHPPHGPRHAERAMPRARSAAWVMSPPRGTQAGGAVPAP